MECDMRRTVVRIVLTAAATALAAGAAAQTAIYKQPTPAEWAALAKLPDFSGVWEIGGGGGGGRGGRGAAAAGPQFTPAAEARRKELQARGLQDSETANCLPPGMPGIMGQPYPMEFLLTPGKVTIVIEAYQIGRAHV